MTATDIITNALIEIGVQAPGESLPSEQATFCLSKLNRLLDNWNTESLFIYGTQLFQGTLQVNHNPHTIGLSPSDFIVATSRPPKILKANLVLTDVSPNIFRALEIVDDAWWMNNPVPSLATQIPYYLWPNYGWPQGQLYLWPVPTKAYDIQLDIDTLFTSFLIGDTFSLPPGYEDAVTLSLAEALMAPLGVQPSATLIQSAAAARARVKGMNSESPTMACDAGVQSMDSRPNASIANFLSGFLR